MRARLTLPITLTRIKTHHIDLKTFMIKESVLGSLYKKESIILKY